MKIGLSLSDFTLDEGPTGLPAYLRATARAADDCGFESLWVMDHFFQIPSARPSRDMLEGYSTLGVPRRPSRRAFKLGTLVTGVTYRHPGVLAKTVTTLDVLSGGRAWLGIGAAWFEREHLGLGVPFPPLRGALRAARGGAADRAPDVVGRGRAVRGQALPARRDAQCAADDALDAAAARSWSAVAASKKTLRLVAQYADACNIQGSDLDVLVHKLDGAARSIARASAATTTPSRRRRPSLTSIGT